jgi:hypothetical protein
MNEQETYKHLQKFRDKVIKEARKNLAQKGKNASGKLSDSIDIEVKAMPNSIGIYFDMEEYGIYQDKGVSGVKQKYNTPFSYKTKMPPPSKLDKWIVRRGIAPRIKGKFTGRSIKSVGFAKSIQFLIARSIYIKGIEPSLFFTKAVETAYKTLPDELIEKYGLDAEKITLDALDEIIKKYGNKRT